MEGPAWEVLATSATVEYFHTAHLADVLSSSPWTEPSGGDSRDNKGAYHGDDSKVSKVSNSLFDSPPEEVSVSLYLESDPETVVVVAVPRWLSDGEVWEVRERVLGGVSRFGTGRVVPTVSGLALYEQGGSCCLLLL